MDGRAIAPAAGTVLNAIACGTGSAFAIDAHTTAEVTLREESGVVGEIADAPEGDTRLIEHCVELAVGRYADREFGGRVRTESQVPMASGLKSSSAAANATILATIDALGVENVSRKDAARLGVQAARDAGVTVTGAFDDASASMLGGITVTDNDEDELLARDTVDWDVLVWTPDEQAFSADTDIDRCERLAPVAKTIAALALDGRYQEAMTMNGFAFCAALKRSAEPMMDALPAVAGVSLSGTGPSYVAVGDRDSLEEVKTIWETRTGTTWLTTTNNDGARTT